MRRKGFTLIELLVVMCIVSILGAILFPVYANFKSSAMATADLTQLRQVCMAMLQYTSNHDETWPYHKIKQNPCNLSSNAVHQATHYGWPCLLLPYAKSRDIFISPADSNNKRYQRDSKKAFDNEAYHFGHYPSWGYNFGHFAPDTEGTADSSDNENEPIKNSLIQEPSNTLVLANSIAPSNSSHGGPNYDLEVGYYKVYAPDDGSPDRYKFNDYWKSGKERFKNRPLKERGAISYGCLWPRHNGHTVCNVAYADGHVKGIDIDELIKDQGVWKVKKD